MNIPALVQAQKNHFADQQTKNISERKQLLKRLLTVVLKKKNRLLMLCIWILKNLNTKV